MRRCYLILSLLTALVFGDGLPPDDLLPSPVVGELEKKAGPEPLSAILKAQMAQAQSAERELVEKLEQIQQLLEQARSLDSPQNNGKLGRIEMAIYRAQLFQAERQAREGIEAEVAHLRTLLDRHLAQQQALCEQLQQYLEFSLAAMDTDMETRPTAMAGATSVDASQVSFHEVQAPASLQEIASLPAVYGDGSMWRLLLHCNPGTVGGADELVPKGTRLIVPNIHVVRQFDFE